MLNDKQLSRIARLSTTVLAQAIAAFPDLLARSDEEAAAAIVADLIKTQLVKPAPKPDSSQELEQIIQACTQNSNSS